MKKGVYKPHILEKACYVCKIEGLCLWWLIVSVHRPVKAYRVCRTCQSGEWYEKQMMALDKELQEEHER